MQQELRNGPPFVFAQGDGTFSRPSLDTDGKADVTLARQSWNPISWWGESLQRNREANEAYWKASMDAVAVGQERRHLISIQPSKEEGRHMLASQNSVYMREKQQKLDGVSNMITGHRMGSIERTLDEYKE